MGSMSAESMLEEAGLDKALVWHLQSNHYPPIPTSMIPACLRAIENAKAGKWNKKIKLPEGVTWKGKKYTVTNALVEHAHLKTFIFTGEPEEIDCDQEIDEC